MPKIVGVRFKDIGKIYYFSPNDIDFEEGDGVIVETVRGVEYGFVALPPREVSEEDVVSPLKPVVRKATEADKKTAERNLAKKPDAMRVAKEKIEKQLIKAYPDLKASILKTGHHGSDTSSSMEFLEAVSPEYAVISVGENNSYNHPSAETLNKFENLNINYFRTDKNGTVTVTFNENGYKTNAEKQ